MPPALAVLATASLSLACLAAPGTAAAAPGANAAGAALVSVPAPLVDPFIGTDGAGHQSPGPHAPFGMVTWGPDTPAGGKGGGYRYSDSRISGFSLTHL